MDLGDSKKRLEKLAKRYSDAELHDKVFGKSGCADEGILYLTRMSDVDLRLSAWHPESGRLDIIMDDEVEYFAICDYLERNGLIFDSCEAAVIRMRGGATEGRSR